MARLSPRARLHVLFGLWFAGLTIDVPGRAERGYETGLGELFAFNWVVGVLVVTVLAGFPVFGVVVARGWRRKRHSQL